MQKHLNSDAGQNDFPGLDLSGFEQRHHKISDKKQTRNISLLLLHLTVKPLEAETIYVWPKMTH